jgi:hypothetical protein
MQHRATLRTRAATACVALLVGQTLTGCVVYSEKELVWMPSAVGFAPVKKDRHFNSDNCGGKGGSAIIVPLDGGVLMHVDQFYISKNNSGATVATVYGGLYVPVGVKIRFSDESIVARDVSGNAYIGKLEQRKIGDDFVSLFLTWKQFPDGDFTLQLQNIDINGHAAEPKAILYKDVERKVFYGSLCS